MQKHHKKKSNSINGRGHSDETAVSWDENTRFCQNGICGKKVDITKGQYVFVKLAAVFDRDKLFFCDNCLKEPKVQAMIL